MFLVMYIRPFFHFHLSTSDLSKLLGVNLDLVLLFAINYGLKLNIKDETLTAHSLLKHKQHIGVLHVSKVLRGLSVIQLA